jgi:hypothetical protein
MLMIQETDVVQDELLLTDMDFPTSFKHMAHPDDYTVQKQPVVERIFHLIIE